MLSPSSEDAQGKSFRPRHFLCNTGLRGCSCMSHFFRPNMVSAILSLPPSPGSSRLHGAGQRTTR